MSPVKQKTNGKTVKRDSKGRIQKGSAALNPFGAPKRGDSWAETLKKISEMDGPDIAAMWDTQHKEFSKLPQGISVKMLMTMTVVASMLREPSPGLWKEFMDRAEGKIKDVISGDDEHPIKQVIEVIYTDQAEIAKPASGAEEDQV